MNGALLQAGDGLLQADDDPLQADALGRHATAHYRPLGRMDVLVAQMPNCSNVNISLSRHTS